MELYDEIHTCGRSYLIKRPLNIHSVVLRGLIKTKKKAKSFKKSFILYLLLH